MQTKFKRKQLVKILVSPDPEFVEYNEAEDVEPIPITKGMSGKINLLLPDGKYHVEIIDSTGKIIAFAPFDEDSLQAI